MFGPPLKYGPQAPLSHYVCAAAFRHSFCPKVLFAATYARIFRRKGVCETI